MARVGTYITRTYDALAPADKKPKKICSMFLEPMTIVHPTGEYTVPPQRDGRPGYVMVGPGSEREENDRGWVDRLATPATDVALDVIGLRRERVLPDGTQSAPKLTSDFWVRGMFVPEGDEPTEDEISAARARVEAWAMTEVMEGDDIYARTKQPAQVPSSAKMAARFLRLDREWNATLKPKREESECPACRHVIVHGARKCQTCSALIAYDASDRPFWADDPAKLKAAVPR